jgi:hypothetical protein
MEERIKRMELQRRKAEAEKARLDLEKKLNGQNGENLIKEDDKGSRKAIKSGEQDDKK